MPPTETDPGGSPGSLLRIPLGIYLGYPRDTLWDTPPGYPPRKGGGYINLSVSGARTDSLIYLHPGGGLWGGRSWAGNSGGYPAAILGGVQYPWVSCIFLLRRWVFELQSGCTERSTHTCARVPADPAHAPDGGGKVGEGLGKVFMGFYIRKHSQNITKFGPNHGPKTVKIC